MTINIENNIENTIADSEVDQKYVYELIKITI
jgi:hypothetical protein